MLGNAWEWVDGGEPSRRVLRGGSFVDYDPMTPDVHAAAAKRPSNHAITPGTRMETTQDSGSANTSFRCASGMTPSATRGRTTEDGGGDGGESNVGMGPEAGAKKSEAAGKARGAGGGKGGEEDEREEL